jgi:hypothetical protein
VGNILVPGEDSGVKRPTGHSQNGNVMKTLRVYVVRRPYIREWEIVRNSLRQAILRSICLLLFNIHRISTDDFFPSIRQF